MTDEASKPPARPARRTGLAAVTSESSDPHPLFHAVGGVLGIFETLLPSFAFVILYVVTGLPPGVPWIAIIASAVLSGAFTIVRLARRESVIQAVVGLVGVAGSVFFVVISGRAENNFVVGIVTNLIYGLVVLVSLIVRRPLVGIVAALFRKHAGPWRDDREYVRVYTWATVLWLALFVIRVAVEAPLYLLSVQSNGAQHQAYVTSLAVTKILLGLPLYVPVLAATWLLVRGLWREKPQPESKNKVS